MFNDQIAVEVLRALRPLTRVTTPNGVAQVVVQDRDKVTVIEAGVVRVYERYQLEDTAATLRGLGRTAYRGGGTVVDAVRFAADHVGRELSGPERELVMAGWAAERGEAVAL